MLPSFADFERIVSKPRLDSYRHYWKVGPDAAIGLYMWNGEVCSEFSKLLSYLEIALRNNIHREMSLAIAPGTSGSVKWWDVYWTQLKQDAQRNITSVRQKAPPRVVLSADEIVSRLSFGFWPNMLSWISKQQNTLLFAILPNHPLTSAPAPNNWRKRQLRGGAIQPFFELNEARNRIAHHEPLWKFAVEKNTSVTPAIVLARASTDQASTMARFARLLNIYDEAVDALSHDLNGYLQHSSWRKRLDYLLSPAGLERYKNCAHVPRAQAISTKAFHQQFASLIQDNRPIKIADQGGQGLFTPF